MLLYQQKIIQNIMNTKAIFIKTLFVVLSMLIFSCSTENIEVKPNILFLFADDWGRYAGIYNHFDTEPGPNSVIQTPNIDNLAEQGIIFTNSYVPAPSCTPCRSSILSGQYFYRTGMGAILQMAEWDNTIPSYPQILKKIGYHIGFTYKVWSPGTPRDIQHGGDSARYENAGRSFNRFSQEVSEAEDPEKRKEELLKEVRDNFSDFLEERKEGQPFCYWFGPTNTHRAWTRGSGNGIWGINPDDLTGKMPDFLPDVHEVREDFTDYLGECQAWDASVGVIIDLLKETGEMNNTIIVVSGDHGIPGFPRAKTNLYDLGTEVALLIIWPEKIKKQRIVDDFVNLMDLAPTFLEVAGAEIPGVMTGKSLMPIVLSEKEGIVDSSRRWVLTGRERHVATAREGNLPYPQRALRTVKYLYIRNFKPERWPIGTVEKGIRDIDNGPTKTYYLRNYGKQDFSGYWDLAFGKRPYEELYDIQNDPDEMINLAGRPDYEDVLNELSELMDSVLIATEDPRMNRDSCVFDMLPYISVDEQLLQVQKSHEEETEKIINRNNK